jgi:hypothetical protein
MSRKPARFPLECSETEVYWLKTMFPAYLRLNAGTTRRLLHSPAAFGIALRLPA